MPQATRRAAATVRTELLRQQTSAVNGKFALGQQICRNYSLVICIAPLLVRTPWFVFDPIVASARLQQLASPLRIRRRWLALANLFDQQTAQPAGHDPLHHVSLAITEKGVPRGASTEMRPALTSASSGLTRVSS